MEEAGGTGVRSTSGRRHPTTLDCAEHRRGHRARHLQLIRDKGRMSWQKAVGYGRRAFGEMAMFRYKALIGPGLRVQSLPAQKTEARAACSVLN